MRFFFAVALAVLGLAGPGAAVAPAADADSCGDPSTCEEPDDAESGGEPTYDEQWVTLAPDGTEYVETLTTYDSTPRCGGSSLPVEEMAVSRTSSRTGSRTKSTASAEDGFEGCSETTDAGARCVDVWWGFEVRNNPGRWIGYLVGTHTLYRVTQKKHFCYNGRRLWEVYGTEWSYDRFATWYANVFERSHDRQGHFFNWNGREKSGHWMRSHVHLEGCSFRYGCLHDYHPRLDMYTYANGVTETAIVSRS